VHGCVVYAELAPRRQQFQAAPVTYQPSRFVSTSEDHQNPLCKATIIHAVFHAITADSYCSEKNIKEQLYKTKEQTNKQKINKQTNKKTYSQWVSLSLL